MSCTHQVTTSKWVEEEDWYHGGTTGEWQYDTVYTTVDIDLHRYKCTQCGEVMYYSGRAEQHFEEGKKFDWIDGLQ